MSNIAVIEAIEHPYVPAEAPNVTQLRPSYTVDGKSFADTVKLVGRAAGKIAGRNKAITLAFRDQRVTVAATDFDVSVAVKLPVKGKRAITVTVEAADLIAFAKALSGTEVNVTVDQSEVLLVSGDVVFTLRPMLDPIQLNIPAPQDPQPFDFTAFTRVVTITGECASVDDARPILTGIYFHDGVAVATDSYRLAEVEGAPAGLNGLVPAAAAKLAVAVFDGDDEVTFEQPGQVTAEGQFVGSRYLVLRSAATVFAVRMIEGEFPNYRQLLRPFTGDVHTIAADTAQLTGALATAALAAGGSTAPARVTITGDTLHVSCRVQDGRSGDDDVSPVVATDDIPMFAVNPAYLHSLLKVVPSGQVRLGLVDALKPLNISDGDSGGWRMLLMPVRVP